MVPPLPLPTRDGVGPSVVVLPPGDWPTIADFLVQRFAGVPAGTWAARLAGGEVVDEHGVAVAAERPYQPRLKLYYYRSVDAEPPLACVPASETVLFRDAQLVVADKPHFMPVTPGGRHLQHTLLVRLKRALGIDTLVPLHRLDRETAGLVLLSAEPATRGAWQALFRERRVAKVYEAIVPWPAWHAPVLPLTRRSRIERRDSHFMRMREVVGAPNAETRIERIGPQRGGLARLRLVPLTGRTHQLRVHCAAIGLPIAGDTLYPLLLPLGSDDPGRPLQLLARSLAFADPLTGEPRRFDSRLALQWPEGDAATAWPAGAGVVAATASAAGTNAPGTPAGPLRLRG